jgi:CBS domain-containing protein
MTTLEEHGMKLSEIMTREVEIVQPDDSLQQAARKMRDRNIGFLPVCDGTTLIGVLSDRDLTIRALAEGMDGAVMLSRDLMTTPAVYCFDDQEASEAARIMEEKQIRRLVVISREDERLVGVVSLGDLARKEPVDLSGSVLQKVSEPEPSQPPKDS